MKQPNDTKTLDMLNEEKRGRGRPRLEHAMTGAERARLCRLKKKLNPAPVKRDVTDIDLSGVESFPNGLSASEVMQVVRALQSRNAELRDFLKERSSEVVALRLEQANLIAERGKAFAVATDAQAALAVMKKQVSVTRNDNEALETAKQQVSGLTYRLDKALEEGIELRKTVRRLEVELYDAVEASNKRDASQKKPVKASRKTVTEIPVAPVEKASRKTVTKKESVKPVVHYYKSLAKVK